MLNQRYGDSYKFTIIDHSTNSESILIPPASLQLVLENVVKHNVGDVTNPLETTIEIDQKRVIVKNKKRLKVEGKNSNEVGIKNLNMRYGLLSDKSVKVSSTPEEYVIELPFINLLNT